jgi:hypothetical protein
VGTVDSIYLYLFMFCVIKLFPFFCLFPLAVGTGEKEGARNSKKQLISNGLAARQTVKPFEVPGLPLVMDPARPSSPAKVAALVEVRPCLVVGLHGQRSSGFGLGESLYN